MAGLRPQTSKDLLQAGDILGAACEVMHEVVAEIKNNNTHAGKKRALAMLKQSSEAIQVSSNHRRGAVYEASFHTPATHPAVTFRGKMGDLEF